MDTQKRIKPLPTLEVFNTIKLIGSDWILVQGSAIGIFILAIVVVVVWVRVFNLRVVTWELIRLNFEGNPKNTRVRVLKNKEDEEKKRKRILVRFLGIVS